MKKAFGQSLAQGLGIAVGFAIFLMVVHLLAPGFAQKYVQGKKNYPGG